MLQHHCHALYLLPCNKNHPRILVLLHMLILLFLHMVDYHYLVHHLQNNQNHLILLILYHLSIRNVKDYFFSVYPINQSNNLDYENLNLYSLNSHMNGHLPLNEMMLNLCRKYLHILFLMYSN